MDNVIKNRIETYFNVQISETIYEVCRFDYLEFLRKEMRDAINPGFMYQYYYDEKYDKIYMHYDISNIIRRRVGDKYKYLIDTINAKLKEMIRYHNLSSDVSIVSPLVASENHKLNLYDESLKYLRVFTMSYWRCFDGKYKFVEDQLVHARDVNEFLMNNKPNGYSKYKEYMDKVLDLNNKYDFESDNSKIPEAFEEYKVLYKETFGKDLYSMEDAEIVYISIKFGDEEEE